MKHGVRSAWASTAAVCLLALLTYWRSLVYPFISDDYIQLRLARLLGSPANWSELMANPLYRCRATSLYLTAATEKLFGLSPVAYNASSIVLHALNARLVLALLAGLGFSQPVSIAAAGFFAVYEGHQEAVIWYAALPELLVLAFSLGTLIFWRRWCDRLNGSWRWYGASLLLFVGALFSKESAVAVVPLLLWVALWRRARRLRDVLAGMAPLAALAAAYAAAIFLARDSHQFFSDGTFSLTPAFLIVLPHTMLRMLFFWGALAAVVVGRSKTLAFSLGWMALTLLPYSFLTYMSRVPSRHTYFPAVGMALLVGSALVTVVQKWGAARPWLAPALASLMVLHNCLYLWIRKHGQYLERAAPTEQLLGHLRTHRQYQGPVWILDFPYDRHVVYSAVAVASEREPDTVLVADEPLPDGDAHTLRWDKATKQLLSN